ncbi:tetratricopeptide repeat protein 19, mitochondrial [Amia ocellicauda]|uniref:tetratricopeptide repeat protein 19, mitochondrial n=1 Tax=Amia ocellicauda TaxID=2972642 RepID=UPI0034649581
MTLAPPSAASHDAPDECGSSMSPRRCARLLPLCAARLRRAVSGWPASVTPCPQSLASVCRRACRPRREAPAAAHVGRSPGAGGNSGSRGDSVWRPSLLSLCAFSFFTKSEESEEDEAKKKEDAIILLLKRAKLSIMQGELEDADRFLHQAARLAHQSHNTQAITYTYSMMGNLAFIRGQLPSAEKLFKAAMSIMLAGGAPEDDDAVIEMSLKLASIYAAQKQHELAEHGFEFCTESLEAKIKRQKELPEGSLPEEERANTRLLLGLCLDSHARYLTERRRLDQARQNYVRALQICSEEQGEAHPQTVVLMNDLAALLDLQGRYQEAEELASQALQLAQEAELPEQHVLLCNMAGILMHRGRLAEAGRVYREALALAQALGDSESVQHIRAGLEELGRHKEAGESEQA